MIRPDRALLSLHHRFVAPAALDPTSREHVAVITRPRVRASILALLLVLLWVALLGWASDAPFASALQPQTRLHYDGSGFRVLMGAGIENGRRLGVNAMGSERVALQSRVLEHPIDASDLTVLRYRWQDFPRTLELSFVFRRAEDPDDVQTVTLPPAGAHPGYFDLNDVPAWRGRIVEIGFSQFPTAQLVPADVAFQPFELVEAELWSPSWRGSLGALATDWIAYRPWALMSVSALGPDAPWPHKPTPVIVLAIGLAASIFIAAAVLARGRRWIGVALMIAISVGWIGLDLRWLGEFADRHALTRQLYAGKPWRERAMLEPDTVLMHGARRVRELLAREPANTHVIVAADAVYDTLRLNYHLVPANVAPANVLEHWKDARVSLRNALLIVYATPSWKLDTKSGTLSNGDLAFIADALFEEGDLRIFRLHGTPP